MDIVTHAVMGAVLGSAVFEAHPLSAAAFALGNVLPDLDALSRCLGKRAFLHVHQSHTHAYSTALLCGLGLDLGLRWLAPGWHEPLAGPALALGMALHSTLDFTNTFGITLLAPFSRRRLATEWVFFIDAVVVVLGVLALLGIAWHQRATGHLGCGVQAAYAAALAGYWGLKAWLRRRAGELAPAGTLSLLPSALVPWWFLGVAREGSEARLFRLDARDGRLSGEERVPVLDEELLDEEYAAVAELRAFQTMRALSPAYHVVEARREAEGTRLRCRDLRTRNFATRFGELEVMIDARGAAHEVAFHV
ncbi:MAG: metal-dependent hydrolase [Planctomycetota bacterium]